MTSKSLFFKLMKEDIRRRLWTVILASVVFFFALPVACSLLLQYCMSRSNRGVYSVEKLCEIATNRIAAYLADTNVLLMAIVLVGAVICGISGYAYLHSKKQVDFYHSLPIRRETLFLIHFVDGILIYAVPYLAGLLLVWGICALSGVTSWNLILAGLYGFLLHLVGYLMVYLTTILAVMLTGKLLITLFGVVVLLGYAPVWYLLLRTYCGVFLTTMYGHGSEEILSVRFGSPVLMYLQLVMDETSGQVFSWNWLWSVLVIAVLLFVCLLLYRRRQSEKAGSAMAFSVTEPVVRILLAVPAGLVFALVLISILSDVGIPQMVLWICFGAVVGALLTHGVAESLYRNDIKRCLSHPLCLLGECAAACLIALGFFFDWMGYDSYLPEREKLQSMAVSGDFDGVLTEKMSYFTEDGCYLSKTSYVLDTMELTDYDAAYELAKLCVAQAEKERLAAYQESQYQHTYSVVLRYRLKNGREVTRSYHVAVSECEDLLAELYRNIEYKQSIFSVYRWMEYGFYDGTVTCQRFFEEKTLTLTLAERQRLVALYCEEFSGLGYAELQRDYPVAELMLTARVPYEKWDVRHDNTVTSTLPLYRGMTQTLQFLQEHGFTLEGMPELSKVSSVRVHVSGQTEKEDALEEKKKQAQAVATETSSSWEEPSTGSFDIQITDPALFAECVLPLVEEDILYQYGPGYDWDRVDERYYVSVVFSMDEYGNEYTVSGYYRQGEVPECILKGSER